MGLLSSIIGIGGTIYDSIAGRQQYKSEQNFNASQAQLNRDFQREERELAQAFNVSMWNMNNEYNSMSNQVQRAIDAGVNPNALFSNGASAYTPSPVTTSPMSGSTASSPGSLASSYIGRTAQLSNILAQNELLQNQAEGQDIQNKFDKRTFNERVRQLRAQTNDILSQSEFRDVDKDIKQKTYEWFAMQSSADLKLKGEQLNELRNKIILLGEQIETANIEQQGKVLDNQGKVYDNQGKLLDNQGKALDNQGKVYDNQGKLLDNQGKVYDNQGKLLDNQGKALDNQGKVFSNAILEDDAIIKQLEVEVSQILGMPVGTPAFDAQMLLFKQGKWNDLAEASSIANTSELGQVARILSNGLKGTFAPVVNALEAFFTR